MSTNLCCLGLTAPHQLMYWLQMTLYTRVLVNITKRMNKETHFTVHVPKSMFGLKISKLSHYNQNPFKNVVSDLKIQILMEKQTTKFLMF